MKNKSNSQSNKGFNASRYRRMAIIFAILSVINIATVMLAFTRSGYGLYHAEDALSHVAKINHYVLEVNESVLSIVINKDDSSTIAKEVASITSTFTEIDTEIEEYEKIDLDSLDPDLKIQFNDAKEKVTEYHQELLKYKNEIQDYTVDNKDELSSYVSNTADGYIANITDKKDSAASAVTALFDKQSQATYNFFVRSAQQFVFVLLFLFITMGVGLFVIRNMKIRAIRDAKTIEEEQKKAQESREKSVNIAYSNILTGFKNRYGLEVDINDKLSSKKMIIAMYNFNDFRNIKEKYGRDTSDEFISVISGKLQQKFAKSADIYSTDNDEFLFIFKKNVNQAKADETIYQIADAMSKPVAVSNHSIQNNVSACFCHYNPGDKQDLNSLLLGFDRALKVAKEKSVAAGQTSVVNMDTI